MLRRSLGLCLAGILLYSSIQHTKNPFFFLGTVYSYELLPPKLGMWVASLVPLSQFLLSALIMARFWESCVAILTSVMFASFATAQSLALVKGLVIPCGCFGVDNEATIGWESLVWVFSWLGASISYVLVCLRCQFTVDPTPATAQVSPRDEPGQRVQESLRSGFTLIEMLVVVSIIGMMIALLLPAVQMARESSRRNDCANRVRQLGLAILQVESAHKHLPTGGWGKKWVGYPGHGVGLEQPGGWIYQVLPFIEQAPLHELGGIDSIRETENLRRLETPVSILHCPSRRGAKLYPNSMAWKPAAFAGMPLNVARNDYAMNGGSIYVRPSPGPDSFAEAKSYNWADMKANTGLCFQRSRVKLAEIRDGLSNTYLLGEKHLANDRYESGRDWGDNESAYSGDNRDLVRYTGSENENGMKPLSDASPFTVVHDTDGGTIFGSAHRDGFNMMNCDGSVRYASYSIDQRVHSLSGSRSDGKTIPE
jgi:prepilin-type N-terminal cleavage/methylation domain-containing protein